MRPKTWISYVKCVHRSVAGLGVALRPPRTRATLPERPWTPPGIPEEYTPSHPVLGHHRADMPGRSGAECRLLEAGLAEPRRLGRARDPASKQG